MRAESCNYGDVFIHRETGEEVRVSERNDEKVFISESGDVLYFIDEDYYV